MFNAPDERRNGLRWRDVDLENGTLEVLGKSREYQCVPLPERVCKALERYRQVAEPPIDDAFVFPTAHAPSKYGAVRNQLEDADEFLENTDVDTVIREHEIVVPRSVQPAHEISCNICARRLVWTSTVST